MSFFDFGSSLPNLHPALVHFPIALVPLALVFDLAGVLLRKAAWLDRAAATLWLGAGALAFVAVRSGEAAADGLVGVPPTVDPLIGTHSDWGHRAFYAVAIFALLRLGATMWDPERKRVAARWALLLPELALLAVVAHTADLGGELVYGHGIAVHKTPVEELRAPSGLDESSGDEPADAHADGHPASDPSGRLHTVGDGTVWQPAAGDGGALGSVVTALGGSTLDAVQPGEPAGDGLVLQASGESWLALPGSFGDVRVEVELDVADFEGEIGLFHHAQEPAAAGLLVQNTDGSQSLWELRAQRRELHRVQHALPDGVFVLAVSSAGKHLKGLVDGATVTHGHIEPGPEGRVGLLLRGQGSVRLVRLSAQPL